MAILAGADCSGGRRSAARFPAMRCYGALRCKCSAWSASGRLRVLPEHSCVNSVLCSIEPMKAASGGGSRRCLAFGSQRPSRHCRDGPLVLGIDCFWRKSGGMPVLVLGWRAAAGSLDNWCETPPL